MRFDACAESYDAYAAPQRAFAARVADFIRASPCEQIVEFGAGTGALTRHLCAVDGITIQATDASPAMATMGRKTVPTAHWSVLDAFGAQLPRASLQVSSGLLQWATDPVRVLQRWKAALSPGGRMAHAFPCEPCLAEWRALVNEGPVLWRDETTWCGIFAGAGLRVRRKSVWVQQAFFPSALDMLRAMHRSGVTDRARLGPGRLRSALRVYDTQHLGPNGVVATWAWLAVEAVAADARTRLI